MLAQNAAVIYGSNGIFRVDGTHREAAKDFYVLRSMSDPKSCVYLPADNPALLQRVHDVLSKEEVLELIDSMPKHDLGWISDDRQRAESFRRVLESGDRGSLVGLIRCIYQRKNELVARGRRLRTADETVFQRAERLLYDEMAFALGISREEVVPYIAQRLETQ